MYFSMQVILFVDINLSWLHTVLTEWDLVQSGLVQSSSVQPAFGNRTGYFYAAWIARLSTIVMDGWSGP